MKDERFFERKCFAITSCDLLKFMKKQKEDDSLTLKIENSYEIYLYSHKSDIEYDEDDILECVSRHLGVQVDNIFIDGNAYYAIIYFIEKN